MDDEEHVARGVSWRSDAGPAGASVHPHGRRNSAAPVAF